MNMNRLIGKTRGTVSDRPMMKYLLCSVFTALIDTVMGWVLIHAFSISIVPANTIGVVISTIIHYFLVTKSVFASRVSLLTCGVYLLTFFLGLALQDTVIWLFYDVLMRNVTEWFRFLFSKGMSLVVSFLVLYKTRQWLYSWADEHEKKGEKVA